MTSKRYFLTLSYKGSRYCGWQIQPNDVTVQATIEGALSTILREKIEITGCGRTDTGVHARYYVAHFDSATALPDRFLNAVNSLLPDDIAVYNVLEVAASAHARYDAYERSYAYYISFLKDPFATETAWFYPQYARLDFEKMKALADVLPQYTDFLPFCKTGSDVEAYQCALKHASWQNTPNGLVFQITANRFLRGMVRLIVGASIQTGIGQISLEEIKKALDAQIPLPKSLSVPPQGLFLTDVKYPDHIFGGRPLAKQQVDLL